MKFLINFLIWVSTTYALTPQQAFQEFYHNPEVKPLECKTNVQKFLQYLHQRGINFNHGYVVSLHHEYGQLNHFDARWGSLEKYLEGGEYYRSNWYDHYFLIIDGVSYDFSQRGKKNQSLEDYIETAYLPKKTVKLPLRRKITRKTSLQSFINLEMRVYEAENYRTSVVSADYIGTFLELVLYSHKKPITSTRQPYKKLKPDFEQIVEGQDGSAIIFSPRVEIDGISFPLLARPRHICRIYGYLGSHPKYLKYEVTDQVKMVDVETRFNQISLDRFSTENLIVSGSFKETWAEVPGQPLFHYATKVRCSDLQVFFSNLGY